MNINIRPALSSDQDLIRTWVKQEGLDLTSLKWKNFMLAESNGQVVAIGQIKPLPGCNELGSLVTRKDMRRKHLASQLIEALSATVTTPIYLLCMEQREPLYQKSGFTRISFWQAPAILKLKLTASLIFRLKGIRVIVMRR
ncbi:hypothetical protein MASR2M15_19840 [Anaerolineales bacterium]